MKDATDFEKFLRSRMGRFARLSPSQVAASRARVWEGVVSGRLAPLCTVNEAPRDSRHVSPASLLFAASMLIVIGSAFFFWRIPLPSNVAGISPTPSQAADLQTSRQSLPLEEKMVVPPPVSIPRLAFEVISIRAESTPLTFIRFQAVGDRFISDGTNLSALIRYAYKVESFQVVGGPGWVHDRNVQFHVEAKAERPVSNTQVRTMLQSLLADRFQLKLVQHVRQADGYLLRVDKIGPKFKATAGLGPEGCFPFPARCTRTTMSGFAEYLSAVVLRTPVLDRTSLTGIFDLTLEWRPDSSQFGGNGGVGFFAGDPAGPSVFSAIREQLGLVLEPSKVPLEILTIDHVQLPEDN